MKFIEKLQSHITASALINIFLQVLLYVGGFFINAKIINGCWKTRNNSKTWQLHIIYSISCTILYALEMPFIFISNGVPHLATYTGEWICYLALFNIQFFGFIITMNSLLVAFTKYLIVVHSDKASAYGHEKIQRNIIIFALVSALLNAILSTVAKDYELFPSVTSCFGLEPIARAEKIWKGLFFCPREEIVTIEKFEYAFELLKQIICVSKSILVYFMMSNLPEAFLYYKIFKKIKM